MPTRLKHLALLLFVSAIAASAQTTPATIDQLAKPPATAQAFTVLSLAGNHGMSFLWTTPDGTLVSRDSLLLRGQVWETDETAKVDSKGFLTSSVIKGYTPNGDAAENFSVANGKASWKSPVDSGSAAYTAPAYYVTQGGGSASSAHMLELLIATPDHSIALLPSGRAHAEKLTDLTVGPAASITAPASAQTIDGTGKTLVPGLWDSHMHFGDDSTGPFLLALGITSARDPGNDNQLTIARARRRAAGELLSPTVYPSVLIDGKGPNSAQVGTVVTSEAEAIAAVDKAKAEGFVGIKFYGTYNPAWVAPAAAEAHKLGLHVHGHVPAGMKPSQTIAAGYDEITHIYFVSMEAMPDSIVNSSNGINRFEGTGRYMKDVDLNAPPLKSLIATMAEKHIVSDPTLVVAESLFVPENGDLSPAYAPYVGTLPPASERGFRQGGFTVPKDLTRADYRASFTKLSQLVALMHSSGISVVAGTNGSGLELVRELELYVAAGFTPSEALAAATIVPARNVGVDKTTGSIAIGKAADLVLVEGDPSTRIGDLRNTRTVMLGGNLLDADALRSASGFSGRPKAQ